MYSFLFLVSTVAFSVPHDSYVGPRSDIRSLCFEPSSALFAVGDDDGTVRLWDLSSQPPAQKCVIAAAADGAMFQVLFAPKKGLLATLSSQDKKPRLWDLSKISNPRELKYAAELGDYPHYIAISSDGHRLAFDGGKDRSFSILDLTSRPPKCTKVPNAHADSVFRLCFSEDGEKLLTLGGDEKIRLWRLGKTIKKEKAFVVPLDSCDCMAFGTRIVYTSILDRDGNFRLVCIDPHSGEKKERILKMPQHVRESAICSKESTVVVADRRGMVKIWDINSGKALAEFDVQFEVRCLAISNDGQRIGVGGNDGRLLVVTKKSGKFEQILRIP